MIALIAVSFFVLVFSPSASVHSKPSRSTPALRAAAYSDCFAMCEHASHGAYGWIGPLRSGHNGSAQAENDAFAHNSTNKGHTAWSSCNEPQ